MSEMKEIRKFGVLSTGKVLGVVYLALGLLVGIPLACLSLFSASLFTAADIQDPGVLGAGFATGVGGLLVYGICIPIFYAVLGFIGGAIGALIYNIVAGSIGGIEIVLGDAGSKY